MGRLLRHCRWPVALSVPAVAVAVVLSAPASGQDVRPAAVALTAAAGEAKGDAEVEARIARLIEQLAADDFAARERAQAELSRLGLEAFDALHLAQNHHEPEIALRARYLVRSMSVRWFAESDSPQVVSILKGYGDLIEPERRSRIDRLAGLPDGIGTVPLARLSRFETSEPIAKYAALKVLQAGPPADEVQRAGLIASIDAIVGNSKRTAAGWLRLYARTLKDPQSLSAEWEQLTRQEHETLTKNSHLTTEEVVRDLYRCHVDLLDRAGRQEESLAAIRRTFALIEPEPDQVTEVVDWLLAREAWQVALELMQSERFGRLVGEDALLLYRLAETYAHLGQDAKASATAEQALAMAPENAAEHFQIGYKLEKRGLHDWSEREYRTVMKLSSLASTHDVLARFSLSELLHDQGQELPAAEALEPLCALIEKDASVRESVERTARQAGRTPESMIARMHYFFACHHQEQGDAVQERQHLQKAVEAYEEDADVLIAMYRLKDADEAWQRSTRERIEAQAADTRQQIERLEAEVVQADNESGRTALEQAVAQLCNEYAWLVSNTFGDFDDAVKRSHRSLELHPNYYVYLDTLGRCYFAQGDFANAVKYQLQAVRGSHSGQIQRQLDLFVKEAKAAGVELPAELVKQLPTQGRGR